jgi:phenylacetate-CoA ligase
MTARSAKRAGIAPRLGELDTIETASRDEIAALQLVRLTGSLRHAYDNLPY